MEFLSGPGMVLVDRLPQPRPYDVRVDLGGRDIRVPQHGLHAAQVRASLQQVGGEAMPDHVRRQMMKNAGLASMAAQQFPERLAGHRPTPRRYEKIPAGTALQDRGTPAFEVGAHG